MTNIGPAASHIGCPEMAGGGAAAAGFPTPAFAAAGPYAASAFGGGGFGGGFGSVFGGGFGDDFGAAYPAPAPVPAGNPERFVSSMQGGVILGADGNPAGSVPAGSFVDTKTGNVFGADGKAITLPAGGSVDFFDLPTVEELRGGGATAVPAAAYPATAAFPTGAFAPGSTNELQAQAAHAAALASAMGGGAPMKTSVGGMWGPGQGAPMKMGGMHHPMPAWMPQQMGPTTSAGGALGSVAGARGIGMPATLESSMAELIATLKALTEAMAKTAAASTTAGGAAATTTSTPATTSTTSTESGTTTPA
ncbi:MAG: hypothetical protein JWM98_264 [Thermoleophilia bacterium]|nr:hypothetical protein [Thermoleophilia bacterium]